MVGVELVNKVSPRFDFCESASGVRRRFLEQPLALFDRQLVQPGRIVPTGAKELFNQRDLELGRLVCTPGSVRISGTHGARLHSPLCARRLRQRYHIGRGLEASLAVVPRAQSIGNALEDAR